MGWSGHRGTQAVSWGDTSWQPWVVASKLSTARCTYTRRTLTFLTKKYLQVLNAILISKHSLVYKCLWCMLYFLPWGSGPSGPDKKVQWIANSTTQPVCPSSGPRTYPEPGTVLNALDHDGPEPLPAQRNTLSLIIVAGIVPSYGQGTRQSHFRNDPMKYDLKDVQKSTCRIVTYWWSVRNPINIIVQYKFWAQSNVL